MGAVVRGRVETTGTDVAVGALVVRLFDVVDGIRVPLGSAITSNGQFEITYEREATESRPNLLVTVLAPEARNGDRASAAPLMESEVRERAAAQEWFLIQVDLSELNKRRIPLPRMAHAVVTDASIAGAAAETEREMQALIRGRITEVRQRAVAETRIQNQAMDNDLRDRVIQHLTKVKPDSPQRKRFVAPGRGRHHGRPRRAEGSDRHHDQRRDHPDRRRDLPGAHATGGSRPRRPARPGQGGTFAAQAKPDPDPVA